MDKNVSQQSSQLSAIKRQLFQKRLRGKGTPSSAEQTIARRANSATTLLSFAQQRLWFIEHYEEGRAAYNIPFAFRLRGRVHVGVLERSLNEIVRRHEVLRTSFRTIDGKPGAMVLPEFSIALPMTDLQNIAGDKQNAHIETFARRDARHSFNLEKAPLFRVSLFQLEKDEFVLLITIHHIIFDGWSIGVLMKELIQLYDDFSRGKASSLPELPIQYGDFAQWQREWLKGEILERQLAYWRRQLSDCPPLLELPTDRPRPAKQTFCGNTQTFRLSDSLVKRLKALAQQEKSTLFMVLLSAFKVLLYRYSTQEDILVGAPVANRQRSELEGLLGFFVNMLVLRSDLSGNPSFRDVLKFVRKTTLDAQAHQDMPFDLLVEELHPERDLSHQPLFQVAFAFRTAPERRLRSACIAVEPVVLDNEMAKFDLFLEIVNTEQGMRGSIEYNTDLFDAATIRRMTGHFQTLLTGIAGRPDSRISELPLLTKTERHQLLMEWNSTISGYPKDAAIHELFEEQAAQNPEACALVFNDRQLSYRELNRQANQVARYLKTLGVGPDVLVGICVERSLEMIVGVLGILKAGGAYVPFDISYPAERLAFMLEDTQVSVLLTQEHLREKIPSHKARLFCLDADWPKIALEAEDNLALEVKAKNLAYVMYTSGSTGKPKGVCVTHQGVVRLVKEIDYVELNEKETFLQFAPISFDASTFEIWGCLLNGARLVIMPGQNASLEELGRVIRHEQVSILWLTAGLFHLMVEKRLEDLHSVRQLLAGGDVLSVSHVQRMRHAMPTCSLINGYGPTESTTFACCFNVSDPTQIGDSVPIGRPIANTEVYILDRELQPVPAGVFGELHIGGAGLARGYLNRPEFTKEKFIPNPFSDDPEARLYKTGDLARYLPDGNIEFLGRIDHQVKVRGFRIELGEIESVLLQYPNIHEAVVLAKKMDSGDKYLAAYLVIRQEQELPLHELRNSLKSSLPEYMIPAFFTVLDEFPLTPNGKIDRRALPDPVLKRSKDSHKLVAPRNPAEERMAEIWSSLLPVKSFGIHDNFFELGGHSLLTVQLIAEIEKLLQVKLPLWKLFEKPTIAGLVELMQQEHWEGPEKTALNTQKVDCHADMILDETIRPELRGKLSQEERRTSIFLTGATGFLGAYLLHEFLQCTDADIYCLVRASGPDEGGKRLKETLQRYLIWSEPLRSRIIPVPGDLSEPLLGLSEEQFQRLAQKVDVIYHSGAQVNLLYPYAGLKAANISGTQEVLRLAARYKVKHVHHVSTVGVFPLPTPPRKGTSLLEGVGVGCSDEPITEDAPLPLFDDLQIGYAQTKWVAEKLLTTAHQRGIPVSIYRPARIAGHSQTGIWNTSDFACRMLKGCIEAGIAPQQHMLSESWVPVDYVSQAIVHLSQQEASTGQIFHLVNRQPLDWERLLSWISAFGYPIKTLAYDRWRTEFSERVPDSELTPLLPLFPENAPAVSPQRFAYWNTIAGLEGSSISCPPVGDALLYTYFAYFLRSQFLNPPRFLSGSSE